MKKQRNDKSRTEAVLSVVITTALVLTLAITVATAINKGNSSENNNIVDLNETDSYDAQLNNEEITTQSPAVENATENLLADNRQTDDKEKVFEEDSISLPDNMDDSDDPDAHALASLEEPATQPNVSVDTDSVKSNLSFSENSTLYWPVTGDIILKYNMDNTIWFPTLGVYKCSPAIYIASEAGTKISASCAGVVESISNNEETGTTITVSVGNGYTVTYGQVDNPQVVKGDLVKAGDTIGYVAEPTIYYTKEGSGLHFQVECDGTPCDPMTFLE